MEKKVRIGMVGAGWMGKAHVNSYSSVHNIYGEKIGVPVMNIIMDVNEDAVKKLQNNMVLNNGQQIGMM